MRTGIFLALLFLAGAMLETSLLHALGGSLAHIPLMMIIGMIIMQRGGIEEGIAWFLALGLIHGDISAWVFAAIGPMLVQQIFTTRSVYALIGLGVFGFVAAKAIALCLEGGIDYIFETSFLPLYPFQQALTEGVLLIPGLFLGILFLRLLERRVFGRIRFRESV